MIQESLDHSQQNQASSNLLHYASSMFCGWINFYPHYASSSVQLYSQLPTFKMMVASWWNDNVHLICNSNWETQTPGWSGPETSHTSPSAWTLSHPPAPASSSASWTGCCCCYCCCCCWCLSFTLHLTIVLTSSGKFWLLTVGLSNWRKILIEGNPWLISRIFLFILNCVQVWSLESVVQELCLYWCRWERSASQDNRVTVNY